jgi:hypothetical protein
LEGGKEFGGEVFMDRRELGIICIAGKGVVSAEGQAYPMKKGDGLYIGKGVRDVVFSATDPSEPPKFYLVSSLAHTAYPTVFIPIEKANPRRLGEAATVNVRTINISSSVLTGADCAGLGYEPPASHAIGSRCFGKPCPNIRRLNPLLSYSVNKITKRLHQEHCRMAFWVRRRGVWDRRATSIVPPPALPLDEKINRKETAFGGFLSLNPAHPARFITQ